jgi:DNA primase
MGGKVSKYLSDRGVSDASVKTFRLGYAPDSWEALGDFLRSRKFSESDIIAAGLAVRKEAGSESASRRNSYDRFRKRIMFPIFDLNGSAVGFAGRIFAAPSEALVKEGREEGAKYVNTPQTAIYDKSRLLYGLNFAKLDIRRANKCVVVEGNMDVIMSHQAGLANTVASSGTALTDGHLRIIKRYTENLDLCFDADAAGSTATDRGVDLALARGFNVGIISVNEEGIKDAADFVLAHGAEWKDYAEKNTQPFLDFYFSRFKKTTDLTTALGKKTMSQKIFPLIVAIPNTVEREHWVQELAFALHMKEDIIRAELAATPNAPKTIEAEKPNARLLANPLSMYEENMLALALRRPALYDPLKSHAYLFSDGLNESIVALAARQPDAPYPMAMQFAQLKADEVWKDFDDAAIDREFEKLLNQIKKRTISKQLEHLEFTIKEAEHSHNKEGMNVLLTQFSKLSKELISL